MDERRADGWQNNTTGQGIESRDKTVAGVFWARHLLTDFEITQLFNGNDLAHRIIVDPVEEMLRRGWESDAGSAAEDRFRELAGDEHVQDAAIWARAYGGGAIFIGAPYGDTAEPLPEGKALEVDFLHVLDKRDIVPESWDLDPRSPTFGKPLLYMLVLDTAVSSTPRYVHASRIVRFDGATCDRQTLRSRQGWRLSVLQRTFEVLRAHDIGWDAALAILSDFSQGVFKMSNVLEMMSGPNAQKFIERMRIADMTRSSLRALVIDKDKEEFTREASPTTGLPELLDRFMMRLAASCDPPMPVTKLYGRAPAGLNATGESDMKNWYDGLATRREKLIKPAYERLLGILSGKAVKVKFPSLYEPTDQEKAATAGAWAQADKALVEAGIVTEEEVALSRWDSEGCIRAGMTAIDREARETAMAARPYDVQAEERATMAQAAAEGAVKANEEPEDGPPAGDDAEG